MDPKHNRRWLVRAIAVFLMLFVLWILAVFQLSPAAAGPANLQLRLRSNLVADYTAGPVMRMVRSLSLTVMQDVMQDMGMPEDEAASEMRAMQVLLETPVPTVTARNLAGDAPFTATPTKTPVPTDTPQPTDTPTRPPRPTATPTKEPTEKPTKKPKTATPVTGPVDTTEPEICCTDVDPPEGPLSVCTIEFLEVEILDPAFSDGVGSSDVYGKYEVDGKSGAEVLSGSGGFVAGFGSDWRGTFSGSLAIGHGHVGDVVVAYAKVKNEAGDGYITGEKFDYTLEVDCDD
jgi:hypothetical protein